KGQFVPPPVAAAPAAKVEPVAEAAGDDITDDEFEALLDQLHGKGKFVEPEAIKPVAPTPAAKPAEPGKAVAKPAPKPAAKVEPAKAPAAAAAPVADKVAPPSEAETTVRVDTARL